MLRDHENKVTSMRKKPLYKILLWVSLCLSVLLLVKLAPILYSPKFMLADDFGRYWASAKLFINQENPYDLEKLAGAQIQAGADRLSNTSIESQILNPPWALLLFAIFGFFDYSLARLAWLIICITLIVIVVRIFWQIFDQNNLKLGLALFVAFMFSPTYSVLTKGQVTPWIILGVAGLLYYLERRLSVWLAGVCIVLISVKPQLLYLLWPTLGLWVITKRQWKLFFSGLAIGIVAILIVVIVNPQIFSQYITAIQEYPYEQWATPTIGSYLRFFWLGMDKFWAQYIPAILGVGWLIFHYWKNHNHWVWRDQIPLITVISWVTSPYAWTYDAIIILPAVLLATIILNRQNLTYKIIFWSIYLIINLSNLLLHMRLADFWFVWFGLAFFVWYLSIMVLDKQRIKKCDI